MASPDGHTLTFLRGSGFLLSLVGVWDLMADTSSPWPSQKGFLIFNETKMIAVIERTTTLVQFFTIRNRASSTICLRLASKE